MTAREVLPLEGQPLSSTDLGHTPQAHAELASTWPSALWTHLQWPATALCLSWSICDCAEATWLASLRRRPWGKGAGLCWELYAGEAS